jgi:hypothetical protein
MKACVSFYTLKVLSINQEESYASVESLVKGLKRLEMTVEYYSLLDITHRFGSMLNEIVASELSKVTNFDCVACANNLEIFLVVDGCYKLSRSNKTNLLEGHPSINRFFLDKKYSQNAHRSGYDKTNGNNVILIIGCTSNFSAARAKPNKRAKRHDETGVLGLFCARHGTPLVFADMFEGELFSLVDMVLEKYLETKTHIRKVFLYYDINCRYKSHFIDLQKKCKIIHTQLILR